MNNIIAISIGDIKGIGIDLLIKLWKLNKIKKFILFTNIKILEIYLYKRKLKIKINKVNNELNKEINFKENYFNIYDFRAKSDIYNTYFSLIETYNFAKKKKCIGIVTLPLSKYKIKKIDKDFVGQTEFYQKLDNKKISNMLFIKNKLIIIPLTTHIKINSIVKYINKKNFIFDKIQSINKILINDFKIYKPKILISGINPHAGERGEIGTEENNYLIPNVNKLKKNIYIDGPISGDSMLTKINLKKYDCFVFNFHDQALIPFKFISNYEGINFTGGLSVIRVSPDHGTAYQLVGKKNAKFTSLLNCFKFVNKIYKNRNKIA